LSKIVICLVVLGHGKNTNGVPDAGRRSLYKPWPSLLKFCLACQRALEHGHTWPPQRISLRLTMGLRGDQPIRMAGMSDVPVLPVAIRRRGLREPSRVTDRGGE